MLENQASRFCRMAERDSQFLSDPAGALERAGRALLQEPGDVELYLGFVRGLGVSDTQGQLLRAVGITVVGQVVARLCKDAGESALAYTVELAARVAVLAAALPALGRLLKYLGEIAAL